MRKIFTCIVGLALFLFAFTGFSYASVDIVLKIDGIDGESKIEGHEDEIDVLSWDWGVTQSGSLHVGGGGGFGIADVEDLQIVKYVDKSSVNLLRKCFNGAHLNEAVLTVRKAGEEPIDYMVITLSPVLVTSVSAGGEGGMERLTEVVTLNFAKVKFSYFPQKEDGSADASIDFTWNIETNLEE
jgi:type VI secretion system secreted protein Hcp